jgi:hypothetical protein
MEADKDEMSMEAMEVDRGRKKAFRKKRRASKDRTTMHAPPRVHDDSRPHLEIEPLFGLKRVKRNAIRYLAKIRGRKKATDVSELASGSRRDMKPVEG